MHSKWIDFEKAYDSVRTTQLWKELYNVEITLALTNTCYQSIYLECLQKRFTRHNMICVENPGNE